MSHETNGGGDVLARVAAYKDARGTLLAELAEEEAAIKKRLEAIAEARAALEGGSAATAPARQRLSAEASEKLMLDVLARGPMKVSEAAEAGGVGHTVARAALERLFAAKKISRNGQGGKGSAGFVYGLLLYRAPAPAAPIEPMDEPQKDSPAHRAKRMLDARKAGTNGARARTS